MFSEQLIKCEDIHKYISEKKKRTYIIKNLLKKYGYNVPIIDPLTGNIIDGNYEKNIEGDKNKKQIKFHILKTVNYLQQKYVAA